MAEQPDPVDRHVGQMIRARRKMAGVSQEGLAKAAGVTFQQVQKYERGDNRVSASRLAKIAGFLNAPVAAFFPERILTGSSTASARPASSPASTAAWRWPAPTSRWTTRAGNPC
jgi:transcriptional regulator with XRE-family HTH domain